MSESRNGTCYVVAATGREGLGNRLFPWARSVVFAKQRNLKRLRTQWEQLKIGPLLRRETDSRMYLNAFSRAPDELSFTKSAICRVLMKRVRVDDLDAPPAPSEPQLLYEFSGMRNWFDDIYSHRHLIGSAFRDSLAPRTLARVLQRSNTINLHIRLGDFGRGSSHGFAFSGTENKRTPLGWYLATINEIREAAPHSTEMRIFSDGTDDELKEIASISSASIVRTGSAPSDLLSLGCGNLLVGSHGSSFSLWAAFFGECVLVLPSETQRLAGLRAAGVECLAFDPTCEMSRTQLRNSSKNAFQ